MTGLETYKINPIYIHRSITKILLYMLSMDTSTWNPMSCFLSGWTQVVINLTLLSD